MMEEIDAPKSDHIFPGTEGHGEYFIHYTMTMISDPRTADEHLHPYPLKLNISDVVVHYKEERFPFKLISEARLFIQMMGESR